MSDSKDDTPKQEARPTLQQVFIAPDRFVYANALRLYGTGPEIFIEFGRSRLVAPGEAPEALGEIGVVISLQTANHLIAQIQATLIKQVELINQQNEAIQAQLKTIQPPAMQE